MEIAALVLGFVLMMGVALFLSLQNLIYLCQPNQVLIFSGGKSRVGGKVYGYRVIKGGRGFKRPFVERVDMLDLTNMIIELEARNAYAKGGIPLNVHGVANVKVAGHEPMLNNAIERFLGKQRAEIMSIAKATLEGSLRGVLATLTPEQLNEDRNLFAERLVQEVEQDMTVLGLVVDTLKVQNITDDVKYLDSIGRTRSAELNTSARIAESTAQADSLVRASENMEQEAIARIEAEIRVAKAEAEKLIADAVTRRAAVVAEEQAIVSAQVAKAKGELLVQTARLEQVRGQLEADVIQPAKAEAEAMEAQAVAEVAPIIEDGRARAEALRSLAREWQQAGADGKDIFLIQKLEPVIKLLTETIRSSNIESVTVIDTGKGNGGSTGGVDVTKLLSLNEQAKQVLGIDFLAKIDAMGKQPEPAKEAEVPSMTLVAEDPEPEPTKPAAKPAPPVVAPPPKPPKRDSSFES